MNKASKKTQIRKPSIAKFKKIQQDDKIDVLYQQYMEGDLSTAQFAGLSMEITGSKTGLRNAIERERWKFCREIYRKTGIYYPRSERQKYTKPAERKSLVPASGELQGANIDKLAEKIKHEYIHTFPPNSIDTIMSSWGLMDKHCDICTIAVRDKWHEQRNKARNFTLQQIELKQQYQNSVLSDLYLSFIAKMIENEIAYLDGRPKIVTLKDENGEAIIDDKGRVERELIRSGISKEIVMAFFKDRNMQTINVSAQNAQINAANGSTERPMQSLSEAELHEQMKNALTVYQEIVNLKKEIDNDVITIESIQDEREPSSGNQRIGKKKKPIKDDN